MSRLKAVTLVVAAAAVVLLGQSFWPRQSVAEEPGRFTSRQHLTDYIKSGVQLARSGYGLPGGGEVLTTAPRAAQPMAQKEAAAGSSMPADAYSATNVQVSGVDEADVIKNDGRYLYTISGGQVQILEAYPPEKARLLATISSGGRPEGMFLKGSRLVVISRNSAGPGTRVAVYDVSDPAGPKEVKKLDWEGNCVSSRMIGDIAYLVLNMPVVMDGDGVRLPLLTEDGEVREVPPREIYYFDCPDYTYRYTLVVAVNTADTGQKASFSTFLTGASQNVYASSENLYLAGPKAPDLAALTGGFIQGVASLVTEETADEISNIGSSSLTPPEKIAGIERVLEAYLAGLDYTGAAALEEKIDQLRRKFYRDLARERDKTMVYKFSLGGQEAGFRCRGEVNGTLLNQFSMDEAGGYFRVATTSQGFLLSGNPVTRNNIYVMDEDLKVVGRMEGLAPTERIYSARFMGNRVYLVTFRRIDPLFVIDLEKPENPKVLGELKIPGFSDYLHPYDETHLIGVGKEVPAGPEPGPMPMVAPGSRPEIVPPPARPQGVKVALFDVSNPARPVEISRYVVDQPYSDTEVSRNHRAFLFSRARNLMAFPVTFPGVRPLSGDKGMPAFYGQWQGMCVFSVSPEEGIRLKGKIDHPPTAGGRGYEAPEPVKRAAYINDVFYTVSEGAVKLSGIEDLREIGLISLPRGLKQEWEISK